jgi:hypothetical protein
MSRMKQLLTRLRPEIDKALGPLAGDYDIQIASGRGSYTDSTATLKLEITTRSKGGDFIDADGQAYLDWCKYGVPIFEAEGTIPNAEWLGTSAITPKHGELTLIGYAPRSRKYPLLCRRPDGKVFKYMRGILRHWDK